MKLGDVDVAALGAAFQDEGNRLIGICSEGYKKAKSGSDTRQIDAGLAGAMTIIGIGNVLKLFAKEHAPAPGTRGMEL